MPKRALPLTVKRIKNEKRPGSYSDGHGLYLVVGERSKSWIFRYQIAGRRHDLGLGSAHLVSLKEARDRVLDLHRDIRDGLDPLVVKRTGRAAHQQVITFAECAKLYIEAHKAEWRDQKAWPDSMRNYVFPKIGNLPVDRIDDSHVLAVLETIWSSHNMTAARVRGRIEAILDFAATKKYRPDDRPNPARWKGHLENVLAKPAKATAVEHHAAMDWREIPEFMGKLALDTGIPAAAGMLAIYTCARASEAAGARWPEIDLGACVWTVPGDRMKAGEIHRVPLTVPALAILTRMSQIKSNIDDRIFLPRHGGAMRPQAMLKAVLRVRQGITLHGFRSSFRVWCAETRRDRDLAEMSLAHAVGSVVERSYQRSDLFEERRKLMEDWAAHCGGV